jgi:hypothetical protein
MSPASPERKVQDCAHAWRDFYGGIRLFNHIGGTTTCNGSRAMPILALIDIILSIQQVQ